MPPRGARRRRAPARASFFQIISVRPVGIQTTHTTLWEQESIIIESTPMSPEVQLWSRGALIFFRRRTVDRTEFVRFLRRRLHARPDAGCATAASSACSGDGQT